jgi:tetratricopeptide (TPR) repeat protein
MNKHVLHTLCVCLIFTGVPSMLVAQETPSETTQSDDVAMGEALDLMQEGFAFFSEKDYGKAIGMWKKSFDVYPTAIAQFNVAKAYAELNDFQKSRQSLLIARGNTNAMIALPLNRLELIELNKFELDLKGKEEAFQKQEALRMLEDKKKACMAKSSRLSSLGKSGFGVAGAGLVSLGGGAFFAARARSQLSALQPPHADGEDAYKVKAKEFEMSQQRTKIALGVGAGLVLFGGALSGYDMTTVDYHSEECAALMVDLQEEGEALAVSTTPAVLWGVASFMVRF